MPLSAPEARTRSNERVTVEMQVRAAKNCQRCSLMFLDSEEDHHDAKNFAVAVTETGQAGFREAQIDDPAGYFAKAKAAPTYRFDALQDKVYRMEVLAYAYRCRRSNGGSAGADGQTFDDIQAYGPRKWLGELAEELRKKTYRPQAVRRVRIPKGTAGETRPLGIPTVADRVAQMVIKMHREPFGEPHVHPDSYGDRPGKSAPAAVATARPRCGRYDGVIDLDRKGFLDNRDWDLVLKAVRHHVQAPWILRSIQRWLQALVPQPGGRHEERTQASPQGRWSHPSWRITSCRMRSMRGGSGPIRTSRWSALRPMGSCPPRAALQLSRSAPRSASGYGSADGSFIRRRPPIVSGPDSDRKGQHAHMSFDFLGYTFRPRRAKNRCGKFLVSFLPALRNQAARAIQATIRNWRLAATRNNQSVEDSARLVNPSVRGWVTDDGRLYRSALPPVLRHRERALVRWACRKYKRLRRPDTNAAHGLGRGARRAPQRFVHWPVGSRPATGSEEPEAARASRPVP